MKRLFSIFLVICYLICLFPTAAFASDLTTDAPKESSFNVYTAIGDSICAGFSQSDYHYTNGFELTEDNIKKSPESCYVMLTGKAFGSETYNLGKCGCNTAELLDILTKPDHAETGTDTKYYDVYHGYIEKSNLITLEIGSNDMIMSVADAILKCVDPTATIDHQQSMELVEPLMKGDIEGICNTIETLKGIELGPEQINAIKEALSEEKLSETLGTAFGIFSNNLPRIIEEIKAINPTAKLVLLNYYNPYKAINNKNEETATLCGDTTELKDDGSGDVDDGSGDVDDGSGDVDDGSGDVDDGSGDVDDGSGDVDDGSGNVDDGSGAVDDGSGDVDDGSGDVDDGSGDVDDGSGDVDDGTGDVDDGSGDVDDGSGDVDDGSGDVDDGSDKVDDASAKASDKTTEETTEEKKVPKDPYSKISDLIQGFTDQMNGVASDCSETYSLPLVDISDTPTNGFDPHPTTEGHAQIAEKIVKALSFTVNATAEKGGTISPDGINTVKEGGEITFTINAKDGYSIRDVLVDETSVKVEGNTYTFKNITANHTITARFWSETSYTIYTALGDSITAGYTRPEYNGDYSNPSDCYVALAAAQLGVKRENNNNLGVLGLDSGGLLNILNGNSGQYSNRFISNITDSDLISIDIGSNDLTMALLDLIFESLGYNNLTNEQKFKKIEPYLNTTNNELKLESLEDLKKLDSSITDEQIDNLFNTLIIEKNIDDKFAAAYANFTVNWDANILKIRDLNPKAAIVALGYYNVTPELSFKYKGKEYKIFKENEGIVNVGEKYVGMMNQYISKDSKVSGQYIYVDTSGVELLSIGKITIDPHPSAKGHADLADRLVNAVLNVITVTAGAGGTVSPGTKTVSYGLTDDHTYTYTFTPDTGNSIVNVSVDGKSVGTPENYTFKEVSADHTLSVTFDKNAPAPDPNTGGGGSGGGGGYSTETFNVKTDASAGGKVALSSSGPYARGANVTLTITPDEGYMIDYILYDGEKIANTDTFTIRSISSNHSVYVAFKESNEESNLQNPFTDILSTDWFYKEAMYMYGHKIMKGTSETTFGPNVAVSRAMIVAILYRMENEPAVTYNDNYTDVAKDTWYTNAVLWAADKGLLKGYGDGKLGPEDEITREQIVSIMYQYAVYKGYNTSASANLSSYTDTARVSDWAGTAMQWAVTEGLINGKNNQLDPASTATRAEIAAIFYRFLEKY